MKTLKSCFCIKFSIKKDKTQYLPIILNIKRTYNAYFNSSFYIINQKLMTPKTDFHFITTWVARSSM